MTRLSPCVDGSGGARADTVGLIIARVGKRGAAAARGGRPQACDPVTHLGARASGATRGGAELTPWFARIARAHAERAAEQAAEMRFAGEAGFKGNIDDPAVPVGGIPKGGQRAPKPALLNV